MSVVSLRTPVISMAPPKLPTTWASNVSERTATSTLFWSAGTVSPSLVTNVSRRVPAVIAAAEGVAMVRRRARHPVDPDLAIVCVNRHQGLLARRLLP